MDFALITMKNFYLLLLTATVALAAPNDEYDYDFSGPDYNFDCLWPNGKFPDSQQCDLYYECVNDVSTPKLCPDGLVFDNSTRNYERCALPHNVDCTGRELLQEPSEDRDKEKCPRANGFFEIEEENVCDAFYTCDKGVAFRMPCSPGLVFDIKFGTCVFENQASPEARVCEKSTERKTTEEGFSCPFEYDPTNYRFPHPTSCINFYVCLQGGDPIELGCTKSEEQAFHIEQARCLAAVEVPGCECTYSCEAADCDDCNEDCSCGAVEEEQS